MKGEMKKKSLEKPKGRGLNKGGRDRTEDDKKSEQKWPRVSEERVTKVREEETT